MPTDGCPAQSMTWCTAFCRCGNTAMPFCVGLALTPFPHLLITCRKVYRTLSEFLSDLEGFVLLLLQFFCLFLKCSKSKKYVICIKYVYIYFNVAYLHPSFIVKHLKPTKTLEEVKPEPDHLYLMALDGIVWYNVSIMQFGSFSLLM